MVVRTYISLHRSVPSRLLHPPAMHSSSHWSILPVEIQLAITHHLDINTLLSLSLVSHHNYTLCLPAVYSVRCNVVSPPSVLLIGFVLVGHPIIPSEAPTLPTSRASRPRATHPRTRCQHRREQPNTGGVFRRTRSYTRPHSPSPIPLSPSFDQPLPTGGIIFLSAGTTVRSCRGALPR